LIVSGITYSKNDARITIRGVPDRPGIAAKILNPIAEAGILVDMIVQSSPHKEKNTISFTVPKTDFKQAMEIERKIAEDLGAEEVWGNPNIAKVSVVGVGMKSHAGVASKMFGTLADENINIKMISTSEIRISCVIDEKYTQLAVNALHTAFGLDKEE